MNYFLRILLIPAGLLTLISCDKDPAQVGCTDQHAVNYDPSALKDDGTCTFNDKEQLIWANGMRGGWNGDLLQGAFRLDLCAGEVNEISQQKDSSIVEKTLYLGTGGGFEHKSYFSLINERNGQDFAEGSLRMGIRVSDTEDGSPEYIRLYIGGKILQIEECNPHRRSDFVEISTHSFNDSTYTNVNIPIRNFDKIMMAHVNVVCGIQFEGERSTGIEVDNIRWVANKLD